MFRLFFSCLLLISTPALAADVYIVDGKVQGFFCRYFGFVCSLKNVDALSIGNDAAKPIPLAYADVSEYKVTQEGKGRCWITTKTDESEYGWLAVLWDWWTNAPTFYALGSNGTYDKLGSPNFIVFSCTKTRWETEACFGKTSLEKQLLLYSFIATEIMDHCSDKYFSSEDRSGQIFFRAGMSEETLSADCFKRQMPLHLEVRKAVEVVWKTDGEERFCAWAKKAYDAKSNEFISRIIQIAAPDKIAE
jgi:hypothetical protein